MLVAIDLVLFKAIFIYIYIYVFFSKFGFA